MPGTVVLLESGTGDGGAVAQTPRKTPASIEDLQNSIKHDPSNPKLHVALGLAYWDHNDYPHAFVAFQQAVKVGPASAEAHNWLGVAVLEKADLPGAIAEFRKAVALDPKYARAYTNLGSALAKSGNVGAGSSRDRFFARSRWHHNESRARAVRR